MIGILALLAIFVPGFFGFFFGGFGEVAGEVGRTFGEVFGRFGGEMGHMGSRIGSSFSGFPWKLILAMVLLFFFIIPGLAVVFDSRKKNTRRVYDRSRSEENV
jgi:hypothetical protein